MQISELIGILKSIKKNHGNIEVVVKNVDIAYDEFMSPKDEIVSYHDISGSIDLKRYIDFDGDKLIIKG